MSSLSRSLEEYLTLRRELGFKLKEDGVLLSKFISFLERQRASYITTALALLWATEPREAQPSRCARRLRVVRLFAEYRSATDPRTEVPPKKLLPDIYRRKPPFIYSDEQIMHLMEAAGELPSTVPSTTGLRAQTYCTLLGLLSVTGMRISEALALNREDIDLGQEVLTIRETKFEKSRLVPVHKSTREAMQRYAHFRDRIYPKPKTRSFFICERGTRLGYWGVLKTFVRLSREIGLRGPEDSYGPRIHDFRHRFAVTTLVCWYREGIDVERHIQELSTFLGHVKVSDTYWYLSAVPELLQLAARRVEGSKGGPFHENVH
ncbi:MAG: tyrosine-type recombinase/integrase [Deltaproteobacteria bacterium]|nr:tyrosine-type recombinase/integrase [Deltaproteobacteria bacterium]